MLYFEQNFKIKKDEKVKNKFNKIYKALEDEKNTNKIGYYKLAKKAKKTFKELEEFKATNPRMKSKKVTDVVVIGIGGSSLGTKAVYELLKLKQTSSAKLHFLENVDPLEIENKTKKLKKENSIFIVISKSGTTIETISIFKYVMKKFNIELPKQNCRIIAITDKGSSLSKLADKYKIKQFNIPSNVGGRFSVLSAVGIVPLSLAGLDVKELLKGSSEFIDSFFEKKEEHLLQKAYFYYKYSSQYTINTLFSYSTYLSYFNDWYVQLWGESLGKIDDQNNKVGLTPVGLVGSIDQHSFLQLIIQGPENKTVSFIQIKDFENTIKIPKKKYDYLEKTDFINGHSFNELINEEANATKHTLTEQNIPVDSIILNKLAEENIGALIAYYELLTSATGKFFHINTYDQPGVEFGKEKLVKKFS
ncbi:glucose-6-phosphate isomerase [Arcobacteraceae bacterium]|nr:glucose-6-phosphate isomerase [Arcobacteraceae bacterium]